MDPIEARHLFPLVEHYIHMNHAGVSPLSQRAGAAIEKVVEASVNRPYRDHWAQDEADRVRELIARLINASADSIALTRSTAHGMSLLAQGLDWNAGDNIVGATGEYPASIRRTFIRGWLSGDVELDFDRPGPSMGASHPTLFSHRSMLEHGLWLCPTCSSGTGSVWMISTRSAPNAAGGGSSSPST